MSSQMQVAADLGHFYGERQGIVGVTEKLVVVDRDRMEADTIALRRHSERALVTDKMDLVPALREFVAERGGQDAAAAHGGVARLDRSLTERPPTWSVRMRGEVCRPALVTEKWRQQGRHGRRCRNHAGRGQSVNASSERSMGSRGTKVISGAST